MGEKKRVGRGRRWARALVGLAGLTAGAVGVTVLMRRGRAVERGRSIYPEYNRAADDRWARPGMSVTFRAELMPGRSRAERTYRVARVLTNNRILLEGVSGEHSETEFEAAR